MSFEKKGVVLNFFSSLYHYTMLFLIFLNLFIQIYINLYDLT